MMQTHSQGAHQEKESPDEYDIEERSHRSSRNQLRRETSRDANLETYKDPFDNELNDVDNA